MRTLLVLAALAGSARADTPKEASGSDAVSNGIDAIVRVDPELAKRPATDPNGFTGEIIVPPKGGDAQPWPRGMVIYPKDPNPDRMPNLLLRPWRWGQRGLLQQFEDLAGGVIDALTSPQL